MNSNLQYDELIDLYLRGDLSADQMKSFEADVASNPELRQEFQFQKDMVEGISNYRKMQLKSRLDAIQVGTAWYAGGMIGESLMKIGGGIAAAAIVGSILYFNLSPDSVEESDLSSLVQISDIEQYQNVNTQIQELPVPLPSNRNAVVVVEETKVADAKLSVVHSATNSPKKEVQAVKIKDEYVPKVDVPSFDEVSDDVFVSEEVSIPEVSGNDVVSTNDKKPIDVQTFNKKSEQIRYKYFDGKLFLYGDFKNEPYEILEINSKAAREIYLFHSNSFFKIEVTDGVKDLHPITNTKLIGELTIIRDNKVN
jgi:hypothetical protein